MGNRDDRWGDEEQRGTRVADKPATPTILDVTEKLQLPSAPITSPKQATEVIARAVEQRCNLLAARASILEIPPGYTLTIRGILFPLDGGDNAAGKWSNGVWYEVEGGKLALHRPSLDKLAALAGITSVPNQCQVEQVEPFLWKATHVVRRRELTGQWHTAIGTVEIDARTDPPGRTLNMNDKADRAIAQLRKFGPRQAESKARNRAIRTSLGLQAAYPRHEAERPFVLPVLMFVPDLSDPEVRKMVTAAELGIVEQVYGAPARARIAERERDVVDLPPELEMDTADAVRERPDPPRERPPVPPAREQERERDPEPTRGAKSTGRIPAHPDDDPRFARPPATPTPTETAQGELLPSGGERRPPAGQCSECGDAIESQSVIDFSTRHFQRALCMKCQPRRDASGATK